MDDKTDVIVIGAGLSGLACAKTLTEAGRSVRVLEATERVGGRTYTKRDPNSLYKYVDLGGSYVGPTQYNVLRLAEEFGVKTYKIQCEGDYYFYHKGKNMQFSGTWPSSWNPLVWLDVNNLFRTMDKLLEEVPVSNPWACKKIEEWDNKTAQQFFQETCWTRQGLEFGRSFVNTNYACEPWDVSLIWMLWLTKGIGSSRVAWEVEDGAQDRKFLQGSMTISEKIAERLGDAVMLNKPVMKIQQSSSHDEVAVHTMDGSVYRASHVVVAMPPTMQHRLNYDPPLPPLKLQLLQRVPMGSTVKNQVWYKRPFWKDKGMAGFGSCADGIEIVGNTVDDFRPDCPYHSLVAFVVADQARRASMMTPEERKHATLDFYRRVFQSEEAMKPLAYEEYNWCEAPFYGGCYLGVFPPGVMTRYGQYIRTPHGRVHFAGTETATEWMGYMDGAITAGERAAREVMCAMRLIPQDQVWTNPHVSKEPKKTYLELTWFERHAPSVGQFLFTLGCVGLTTAAVVVKTTGMDVKVVTLSTVADWFKQLK